jgi:hypothetical protein
MLAAAITGLNIKSCSIQNAAVSLRPCSITITADQEVQEGSIAHPPQACDFLSGFLRNSMQACMTWCCMALTHPSHMQV